MTEATDKGAKKPDSQASAGDQLRLAREGRNLTIQQVAQALHLDSWILEALEENRFKDVGAPVFVKGHLRKYASEVGLDGQQLMEAYYRADDTPETPVLVTDTFSRPRGDSQGRWPVIVVSSLLVLLVIFAAYLWFRGGLPTFSADESTDSADASFESKPFSADPLASEIGEPPQSGMSQTLEVRDQGQIASAGEVAGLNSDAKAVDIAKTRDEQPAEVSGDVTQKEAGRTGSSTAASTQQNDGQVRVSITLENDSWLEIYDARNRRLFFDLARSGTSTNVTGAPPLQVLLGNSTDARVRVNGDVWPIPAAARRGKTARFTIR